MHQQTAFPRGTVGFSVFFRKLIKLSHNQTIEACHPRQFQREIRFYWLGEWLSSTLTQGINRCTPLVPGLHVLSSEKERVLLLSCGLEAFQLFSSHSLLNKSHFKDLKFRIFKSLSKRPTDRNKFPMSRYYIFTFLYIPILHVSSSFHLYIFSRFIWFHTEMHYEQLQSSLPSAYPLKCLLGESTLYCLLWKATQTLRLEVNLATLLSPCLAKMSVLFE